MSEAADRLARTRLAIIEQVYVSRHGRPRSPQPQAAQGAAPSGAPSRRAGLREAGRAWWQAHPARPAAEFAGPLLAAWAQRHPLRLLALSAAAGAVLVAARPWRLVSVTGVLLAALKSPRLSSMALSVLMSTGRHGPTESPQPERSTP